MISIVIPAFNVEKYIARCLDSILKQIHFDVLKRDLEIIIINDGSIDNTANIVSEYAQKYDFIMMYSQSNGGLSAARNTGLMRAKGDYIWFIDSDDWIAEDSLKTIFEHLNAHDIDILEFDAVYATESEGQYIYSTDFFYSLLESNVTSAREFLEKEGYIAAVTSKIIKKSLFDIGDIQFPINRFSEDIIVALRLMTAAKTYQKIKKEIYFYYQRADSITNRKDHLHVKKYLEDQILNLKDMDKEMLNIELNKSRIKEMQSFFVSNMLISLYSNKFTFAEVSAFLDQLASIKQYPVKKYAYHNRDLKRKIFRKLANNRVFFKINF